MSESYKYMVIIYQKKCEFGFTPWFWHVMLVKIVKHEDNKFVERLFRVLSSCFASLLANYFCQCATKCYRTVKFTI
jgi:hypothetical protein